ncbi:MAG: hypothetical protein VXY23_09420 [Pseudomonadota bacterium]|nr:hypothetical protein [Pseudomonadota bacterium]
MSIFQYMKSALLFGNLISIIRYIIARKRLYEITEVRGFNAFDAKTSFNEFQRQEEKILYGYSLNIEQRSTQNKLFQHLKIENDVHNLFLGLYVVEDGKLKANVLVEAILFILSLIAVFGTSIIILIATVSVFASALTLSIKLLVATIILSINGYSVFHFYCRFLSTTKSFLKNHYALQDLA